MSNDLTRRIEAIVWQIIAGMEEPEAAIASLIAEEVRKGDNHHNAARCPYCNPTLDADLAAARASARREALEEAAGVAETRHARWHDRDFEHTVCCDVTACADIAAAIRSLAKEAPERQPDEFGHVTRIVDAATHDERCDLCGATDARGDARLTQPCPKAKEATYGQ